jgi:hypothetical protein
VLDGGTTSNDARLVADASAEVPEVADIDTCSNETVAPTTVSGTFEQCNAIDLDGQPPCEVACSRVSTGPVPASRTLEHVIYFTATRRPGKEIGRIVVYDGPLDAVDPRDAATHRTSVFVDRTTSPPTLELRSGSCLFECHAKGTSESACRTTCPPGARYRYDGKRLQPVK